MKPIATVFVSSAVLASVVSALAQPQPSAHFSNWPAGASPAEVGKRVAENFVPRKFRYETDPRKASALLR